MLWMRQLILNGVTGAAIFAIAAASGSKTSFSAAFRRENLPERSFRYL